MSRAAADRLGPIARVNNSSPCGNSQTLRVLSYDPDKHWLPSGDHAHALTQLECPSWVRSSSPVRASQTLSVLSDDPDKHWLPSGDHAHAMTPLECPSRVRS